MDGGRSMRAVNDNLATPLRLVEQLDMSTVCLEALQSLTASTIEWCCKHVRTGR